MTIYEIDSAITSLVDAETGEILDFEAFEALSMEREAKVEGMALWVKELTAEAKAIREEEKVLADRRRAAEKKAERLSGYIQTALDGEKFKTPKVAVTYRASSSVEVDDEFVAWAVSNAESLIRYSDPVPDKAAIKAYINAGHKLDMARIVETTSVQIK